MTNSYRAQIQLGVQGQQEIAQATVRLRELEGRVNRLNGQSVFGRGAVQSIDNYNERLQSSIRLLDQVAAGTNEEARAINAYVRAVGLANTNRDRQNNLIQNEIRARRGLVSLEEAQAASRSLLAQRTNELAAAEERLRGKTVASATRAGLASQSRVNASQTEQDEKSIAAIREQSRKTLQGLVSTEEAQAASRSLLTQRTNELAAAERRLQANQIEAGGRGVRRARSVNNVAEQEANDRSAEIARQQNFLRGNPNQTSLPASPGGSLFQQLGALGNEVERVNKKLEDRYFEQLRQIEVLSNAALQADKEEFAARAAQDSAAFDRELARARALNQERQAAIRGRVTGNIATSVAGREASNFGFGNAGDPVAKSIRRNQDRNRRDFIREVPERAAAERARVVALRKEEFQIATRQEITERKIAAALERQNAALEKGKRQRQAITGLSSGLLGRASQGIQGGLIGGAFPALFGQGPNTSLGGGIGGVLGGLVGGGGGSFAGGIVGSVIGKQLDDLATALKSPTQALELLRTAGIQLEDSTVSLVGELIDNNRLAEAQKVIYEGLNKTIGTETVDEILKADAAAQKLAKATAELNRELITGLAPIMTKLVEAAIGASRALDPFIERLRSILELGGGQTLGAETRAQAIAAQRTEAKFGVGSTTIFGSPEAKAFQKKAFDEALKNEKFNLKSAQSDTGARPGLPALGQEDRLKQEKAQRDEAAKLDKQARDEAARRAKQAAEQQLRLDKQLFDNRIALAKAVYNREIELINFKFDLARKQQEQEGRIAALGATSGDARDVINLVNELRSAGNSVSDTLRDLRQREQELRRDLGAAQSGVTMAGSVASREAQIGGMGQGLGGTNAQMWAQIVRRVEGTSGPNGYSTLFGGGQFNTNGPHPDRVVRAGGYASAAAGAYQAMPDTWRRFMGNASMSPANQDQFFRKAAMARGVNVDTAPINAQNISRLAPEWAGLPMSGRNGGRYGQTRYTMSQVLAMAGSSGIPPTPNLPPPGRAARVGEMVGGADMQGAAGLPVDQSGVASAQGNVEQISAQLEGVTAQIQEYEKAIGRLGQLNVEEFALKLTQGFRDQTESLQENTRELDRRAGALDAGTPNAIIDLQLKLNAANDQALRVEATLDDQLKKGKISTDAYSAAKAGLAAASQAAADAVAAESTAIQNNTGALEARAFNNDIAEADARLAALREGRAELTEVERLTLRIATGELTVTEERRNQLLLLAQVKDGRLEEVRRGEETLQLYQSINAEIGSGLVAGINAAVTGAESLNEVLSRVLQNIGQILIQSAITGLLESAGKGSKGGLIGKIFGFADGGYPPVGRPSLVGEEGPELFVPGAAGRVFSFDDTRDALQTAEDIVEAADEAGIGIGTTAARNALSSGKAGSSSSNTSSSSSNSTNSSSTSSNSTSLASLLNSSAVSTAFSSNARALRSISNTITDGDTIYGDSSTSSANGISSTALSSIFSATRQSLQGSGGQGGQSFIENKQVLASVSNVLKEREMQREAQAAMSSGFEPIEVNVTAFDPAGAGLATIDQVTQSSKRAVAEAQAKMQAKMKNSPQFRRSVGVGK